MSNKNWLLYAALGIGAYLIWKNSHAAVPGIRVYDDPATLAPGVTPLTQAQIDSMLPVIPNVHI